MVELTICWQPNKQIHSKGPLLACGFRLISCKFTAICCTHSKHTGAPGPSTNGVTYTRWGRTTCPSTQGTQLVYEGTTAGSPYYEAGLADYLCLHKEPEFLQPAAGLQDARARLYGTEYEALHSPPAFSNVFRHDAPCSVCYTPTRGTKITIPGRVTCPASWTKEYHGFLMSNSYHQHRGSRVSVCVDINAESVAGSAAQHVKSLFYFIETTCTGVKCPPYFEGAEITCVVCTK